MAVSSQGTKLYIGDGGDPVVWTAIPGVQGAPVPAPTRDEIETSDLDSGDKEFIPGLGDSGEVAYTINIKKNVGGSGFHAAQELLEEALESGDLTPFKITLPGGLNKSYLFTAFVKTFQVTTQTNAQITANLTLRVSGKVTREVAA